MARKIRKDITVKGLEKKLGVAPGTIKNLDGRDARSDKKLETLQKEAIRALKVAPKKNSLKTTVGKKTLKPKVQKPLTADQRSASLRKVKTNPKATSSMVKKVSAAIKKTAKK